MLSSPIYLVQYTHHVTQKHKTFKDGVLKLKGDKYELFDIERLSLTRLDFIWTKHLKIESLCEDSEITTEGDQYIVSQFVPAQQGSNASNHFVPIEEAYQTTGDRLPLQTLQSTNNRLQPSASQSNASSRSFGGTLLPRKRGGFNPPRKVDRTANDQNGYFNQQQQQHQQQQQQQQHQVQHQQQQNDQTFNSSLHPNLRYNRSTTVKREEVHESEFAHPVDAAAAALMNQFMRQPNQASTSAIEFQPEMHLQQLQQAIKAEATPNQLSEQSDARVESHNNHELMTSSTHRSAAASSTCLPHSAPLPALPPHLVRKFKSETSGQQASAASATANEAVQPASLPDQQVFTAAANEAHDLDASVMPEVENFPVQAADQSAGVDLSVQPPPPPQEFEPQPAIQADHQPNDSMHQIDVAPPSGSLPESVDAMQLNPDSGAGAPAILGSSPCGDSDSDDFVMYDLIDPEPLLAPARARHVAQPADDNPKSSNKRQTKKSRAKSDKAHRSRAKGNASPNSARSGTQKNHFTHNQFKAPAVYRAQQFLGEPFKAELVCPLPKPVPFVATAVLPHQSPVQPANSSALDRSFSQVSASHASASVSGCDERIALATPNRSVKSPPSLNSGDKHSLFNDPFALSDDQLSMCDFGDAALHAQSTPLSAAAPNASSAAMSAPAQQLIQAAANNGLSNAAQGVPGAALSFAAPSSSRSLSSFRFTKPRQAQQQPLAENSCLGLGEDGDEEIAALLSQTPEQLKQQQQQQQQQQFGQFNPSSSAPPANMDHSRLSNSPAVQQRINQFGVPLTPASVHPAHAPLPAPAPAPALSFNRGQFASKPIAHNSSTPSAVLPQSAPAPPQSAGSGLNGPTPSTPRTSQFQNHQFAPQHATASAPASSFKRVSQFQHLNTPNQQANQFGPHASQFARSTPQANASQFNLSGGQTAPHSSFNGANAPNSSRPATQQNKVLHPNRQFTAPAAAANATNNATLLRFARVPIANRPIADSFSTESDYQKALIEAVCELVQNRVLNEIAAQFQSRLIDFHAIQGQTRTQPAAPVSFAQPYNARPFVPQSMSLQTFMRHQHKLAYYDSSVVRDIKVSTTRTKESDGEAFDSGQSGSPSLVFFYLTLSQSDACEQLSAYTQGDLWLLSNRNDFCGGTRSTVTRNDYVCFAYSVWRTFTKDTSMIKLVPLPIEHKSSALTRLGIHRNIFAFRCGEISSELAMLQTLGALSKRTLPIWPQLARGAAVDKIIADKQQREANHSNLLQPSVGAFDSHSPNSSSSSSNGTGSGSVAQQRELPLAALRIPASLVRRHRSEVLSEFSLNPDQSRVLDQCISWLPIVDDSAECSDESEAEQDQATETPTKGKSSVNATQTANNDDSTRVEETSAASDSLDSGAATEAKSRAKRLRSGLPSPALPSQHVALVHGAFGSGKSYLLSVCIIFLCRVLDQVDKSKTVRILVASLTNVAVDNVLMHLLRKDFVEFARVGAVRSIAKPCLPHTIYSSSSGGGKQRTTKSIEEQALSDLKQMKAQLEQQAAHSGVKLNSNHHARLIDRQDEDEAEFDAKESDSLRSDYRTLCREISALDVAHRRKRANRLLRMRVLGITCAATSFDVMHCNKSISRFSIVLLDECSQMLEPCSLQPLIFGCERLLAVGDPLQLSPLLPNESANQWQQQRTGPNDVQTSELIRSSPLAKTMFVRLAAAGIQPTLLRTQYRCHPALSVIANHAFYDGQLIDGIKPSDRPALMHAAKSSDKQHQQQQTSKLESLPPLVLIATLGQEKSPFSRYGQNQVDTGANSTGSVSNDAEAHQVQSIVTKLLEKGVAPHRIGVITFYRAQAKVLTNALHQIQVNAQVHQPAAKRPQPKRGKKASNKKAARTNNRKRARRIALSSDEEEDNTKRQTNSDDDFEPEPEPAAAPPVQKVKTIKVSGSSVQVATVDSYQGGEADVIILSTVRTKSLGFIDNPNRCLVALTRARHHLIVLGCTGLLQQSPIWRQVVANANQQQMNSFMQSLNEMTHDENAAKEDAKFLPDAEKSRAANRKLNADDDDSEAEAEFIDQQDDQGSNAQTDSRNKSIDDDDDDFDFASKATNSKSTSNLALAVEMDFEDEFDEEAELAQLEAEHEEQANANAIAIATASNADAAPGVIASAGTHSSVAADSSASTGAAAADDPQESIDILSLVEDESARIKQHRLFDDEESRRLIKRRKRAEAKDGECDYVCEPIRDEESSQEDGEAPKDHQKQQQQQQPPLSQSSHSVPQANNQEKSSTDAANEDDEMQAADDASSDVTLNQPDSSKQQEA